MEGVGAGSGLIDVAHSVAVSLGELGLVALGEITGKILTTLVHRRVHEPS